jgi:ring-1,2-phenylacetyl-CoA epoxidase subunit PaaE
MRTSVAFAAAGGISPALALVTRLMTESPTDRLWLFYGHHTGDHPDELEQLLSLKDRYLDRLSLGFITDRDEDEAELLSGALDGAKVHALSSRLLDAKAIDRYFVFAPDALAAEVRSALVALGVEDARIQAEQALNVEGRSQGLSATGSALSVAAGPSPARAETQVAFVMDGRRRAFPMRTNDESILDAAARAGIELPFSCKAGVCSTCRTKLVRGEVDMAQNYALEDWELQQGFILACQSRAKTPEIELTYDET